MHFKPTCATLRTWVSCLLIAKYLNQYKQQELGWFKHPWTFMQKFNYAQIPIYLLHDEQITNSSNSISNLYLKEGQMTWVLIELIDLTSFEWTWMNLILKKGLGGLISIKNNFFWSLKVNRMRLRCLFFLLDIWYLIAWVFSMLSRMNEFFFTT